MIKVAIVGFGNIGKSVYMKQFQQVKTLRLNVLSNPREVAVDVPVLKSVTELNDIDVAILCLPSRAVPDVAATLLSREFQLSIVLTYIQILSMSDLN